MVPEGKADFNCISYAKMIFHALKYPHCAVFGLLVGVLDNESGDSNNIPENTDADSDDAHEKGVRNSLNLN